jgi:hypothetical protein
MEKVFFKSYGQRAETGVRPAQGPTRTSHARLASRPAATGPVHGRDTSVQRAQRGARGRPQLGAAGSERRRPDQR